MMFESAKPEIGEGDGNALFKHVVIDQFDNFQLLIELSPPVNSIFQSQPWFNGKQLGNLEKKDWQDFADS
jgi:hypothetical protein